MACLPDREEVCCGGYQGLIIRHLSYITIIPIKNRYYKHKIAYHFNNRGAFLETSTLFDMRGEFGCNRILDRFIEQDLKFESFGNLGLKYTLLLIL